MSVPKYVRAAFFFLFCFRRSAVASLMRTLVLVPVLVLAANKADLLDALPSDQLAMKDKDRQKLQLICENGAALFQRATDYAVSIGATIYKTSAKSGSGVDDMFAGLSSRLLEQRLETDRLAAIARAEAQAAQQAPSSTKNVTLDQPQANAATPSSCC